MSKAMNIKDFTYLLLAMLANKSIKINLNDESIRTVSLPSSYKESIEKIMHQGNGWDEEFSTLIDTDEYFDNNYKWEEKFSKCLKEVLEELGKKVEYDLIYDMINIDFKQEEIDKLLEKYQDEEINDAMDHFANLVTDYVFTRRYNAMRKDFEQTKEKYKTSIKLIKR